MSAIEIIDNLDNLNYKFDEKKYAGYKFDDYQIISHKISNP